jgi:HSP20 family protein
MKQRELGSATRPDPMHQELLGLLGDPVPGQRWVSPRQHKIWQPPTDVYETDRCGVVKVEIAGMAEDDFDISLDGRRLTIRGLRHDPAAKLAYQQMEILYGEFETTVHLPWNIEEDKIEATYKDGFLSVVLPKARPRQVPVISVEDAS